MVRCALNEGIFFFDRVKNKMGKSEYDGKRHFLTSAILPQCYTSPLKNTVALQFCLRRDFGLETACKIKLSHFSN